MSQVNLLPPELRQRQARRRSTSLAVVGGLVLVAVVLLFAYVREAELRQKQDDLAAQQAVNARVQTQIAELQKFGDLQAQLQTKQQLISTVYANEVSWSGILVDVSRVIPPDAYLTGMMGQIAASGGGQTTAGLVGSLSFTGNVKGADTLAAWLSRLEQVKGWVNAWSNSANESGPYSRIYQFQSGVDLSAEVVTKRGKGEQA